MGLESRISSLTRCCCLFPRILSSGSRSKLHVVTEHGRAEPAQTQPPPQGPVALRQADGVAEEHPAGEV